MNRQMAAERERRAVVLEADGKREASVKVAEGAKQADILRAEGSRQAAILTAEGARQAAILNAEGYNMALTKIYEAAQGIDQKTMQLQYLDALKVMGAGPATKFIFPMEFTSLVEGFARRNLDVAAVSSPRSILSGATAGSAVEGSGGPERGVEGSGGHGGRGCRVRGPRGILSGVLTEDTAAE